VGAPHHFMRWNIRIVVKIKNKCIGYSIGICDSPVQIIQIVGFQLYFYKHLKFLIRAMIVYPYFASHGYIWPNPNFTQLGLGYPSHLPNLF
jgi:hypothetical protein